MSDENNLSLLIKNQRFNIRKSGNYNKMGFRDLKRLDTYIEGNIFKGDKCIRYNGELKKNTAIFSFKGKKVSLHRLLFHNFIRPIVRSDIIKFKCPNRGLCTNLNHIYIKGEEISEADSD